MVRLTAFFGAVLFAFTGEAFVAASFVASGGAAGSYFFAAAHLFR
jgi:hypothetical protein